MAEEKQWGARYLVGWFLEEFAGLEIDMEQALGWLLGLSPQSASILLRHLIVFRKIEALRLLIPLVIESKEDAANFDKEIKVVIRLNDEFRKEFAHTPFREERKTGNIELLERFTRPSSNEPTVVRVITQDEVITATARIFSVRKALKTIVDTMAIRSLGNMTVLHSLRSGRGFHAGRDHEIYMRLLGVISPI